MAPWTIPEACIAASPSASPEALGRNSWTGRVSPARSRSAMETPPFHSSTAKVAPSPSPSATSYTLDRCMWLTLAASRTALVWA